MHERPHHPAPAANDQELGFLTEHVAVFQQVQGSQTRIVADGNLRCPVSRQHLGLFFHICRRCPSQHLFSCQRRRRHRHCLLLHPRPLVPLGGGGCFLRPRGRIQAVLGFQRHGADEIYSQETKTLRKVDHPCFFFMQCQPQLFVEQLVVEPIEVQIGPAKSRAATPGEPPCACGNGAAPRSPWAKASAG